MQLSLVETNPTIRLTLLRQLALLINRDLPIAASPKIKREAIALEQLEGLLSANPISQSQICTAFWIAKSLILRLNSINNIVPQLIGLLSRQDCGLDCARAFSVLLAPDEILSQENGAIIRKLAKQRVLSLCLTNVSTQIQQADPSTKSNYLIALSGILLHVPNDVMAMELETLLPLLLQSLDLDDAAVRSATIESLTVMVSTNPAAVAEHANSLIKRLLEAASDTQKGSSVCILDFWLPIHLTSLSRQKLIINI